MRTVDINADEVLVFLNRDESERLRKLLDINLDPVLTVKHLLTEQEYEQMAKEWKSGYGNWKTLSSPNEYDKPKLK